MISYYSITYGRYGGYDLWKVYQSKPRARKGKNLIASGIKTAQGAIDYGVLLSIADDLPIKGKFDLSEKHKSFIKKLFALAVENYCLVLCLVENIVNDGGVADLVRRIDSGVSAETLINEYI